MDNDALHWQKRPELSKTLKFWSFLPVFSFLGLFEAPQVGNGGAVDLVFCSPTPGDSISTFNFPPQ